MNKSIQTIKTRANFVDGPIDSNFIAEKISKHQSKTSIGAHDIFLGQVRADKHGDSEVVGIEYTSYEDMAIEAFKEIKEACFQKFDLVCMHIYHSMGYVRAGEICLFVFVSSARRKVAYEALEFAVEQIKEKVPIFGKEVLENESFIWKENTK